MEFELILLVVFIAIIFSSGVISKKIYNVLKEKNNRWPKLITGISFLLCVGIFSFVIGAIIISNMDFGR